MQSQMRKANLFHHRQTKEIQMASSRENTKPLNKASSAIWAHVSYSSLMVTKPWGWTTRLASPPLLLSSAPSTGICSAMSLNKKTKPNATQRWRNSNEHIQMRVCVCVFPLRIALFVLCSPHTELVKALHAVAYFGARLSNMAAEAALLKSARKL